MPELEIRRKRILQLFPCRIMARKIHLFLRPSSSRPPSTEAPTLATSDPVAMLYSAFLEEAGKVRRFIESSLDPASDHRSLNLFFSWLQNEYGRRFLRADLQSVGNRFGSQLTMTQPSFLSSDQAKTYINFSHGNSSSSRGSFFGSLDGNFLMTRTPPMEPQQQQQPPMTTPLPDFSSTFLQRPTRLVPPSPQSGFGQLLVPSPGISNDSINDDHNYTHFSSIENTSFCCSGGDVGGFGNTSSSSSSFDPQMGVSCFGGDNEEPATKTKIVEAVALLPNKTLPPLPPFTSQRFLFCCNSFFSTGVELRRHKRSCHPKYSVVGGTAQTPPPRRHRCTWFGCSMQSNYRQSVAQHVRREHLKVPVTLVEQRRTGRKEPTSAYDFVATTNNSSV